MTIQRAREILGKDATGMSDEEIISLISTGELFADMAINQFLKLTPKEREKFKRKDKTVKLKRF